MFALVNKAICYFAQFRAHNLYAQIGLSRRWFATRMA